MDLTKKLFYKNIFFYFIGIVLGGAINFFSIPLIIEIYGVENYGQFSLIQNIILIIVSFGSGWLNQNILRFNNNSTYFRVNILLLYYVVLLPITAVSVFTILGLKYDMFIALISTFTIVIGGITAIINTFYQSTFNAKKNVFFDIFRVLGFVVLVYLFSFFNHGNLVLYLVISFFISYLIAFIFKLRNDFRLLYIIFKIFIEKVKNKKISAIYIENKRFIQYGLPLSLWFTFSSILNVGDRYIINFYLDKSAVGNYSAIYDLIYKGISISFTPILSAGYPIISRLYNQCEQKKAYGFIRKLIAFEVLILIIATVISLNLDQFFLEKIVRVEYNETNSRLVPTILIGAIIWQIAMLVHKPLELKLKTKPMLVFVTMALIINLAINYYYIESFGIIVAAYATIICASLYLVLCLIYSKLIK